MKHVLKIPRPKCEVPCTNFVQPPVCAKCECDVAEWPSDPGHQAYMQRLQKGADLILACKEYWKDNGHSISAEHALYQALRALGEEFLAIGGEPYMGLMMDRLDADLVQYDEEDWNSAAFVCKCWEGVGHFNAPPRPECLIG